MNFLGRFSALSLAVTTVLVAASPTYKEFMSPASPQEVVAARKVDRIAWIDYAEGKRNAYTAAAPAFTPVRLTNFMKDDGIMMSEVKISADGSTVIFLRGEAPNREGWSPNPTADPNGPEHAIWAARTTGAAGAWRVADASNPELAPDGSAILFLKNGQIFRAKITPVKPASEVDRGEKAFITEWGVQSDPKYSPDGRKIAFVSTRQDHSFICVYDIATRKVTYMSPSVDFDTAPMWTEDSKSVLFLRRPGLPFGQQAQSGTGALGVPNGPAFQPPAAAGTAAAGRGGRGGRGGATTTPPAPTATAPVVNNSPGLMTATFRGGYTLGIYKADAATGEAQEVWHNEKGDKLVPNITGAHLAGNYLVFPFFTGGGRGGRGATPQVQTPQANGTPQDEWDRYYALDLTQASARPVLLTPTDGMIENQTSIAFSADGKTFYYCTNAKDIERRHVWQVPVSGGTPQQITTGEGVETYPAPLASGAYLATFSADWNMPQSLGIWKLASDGPVRAAAPQKIIFPTSMPGFPKDEHVKPQIV